VAAQTIKKIGAAAAQQQGTLHETSPKVFSRMAYGDKEEGIIALANIRHKTLADLRPGKMPLLLVLEGIEKPGNVGAILRTAGAVGVDGVILTEGATDLYNPNTIRASLGAVFSVDAVASDNQKTYDFLNKHKIPVIAATPQAKKNYLQADLRGALALVMGSEEAGLSPFWLKHADTSVLIPMNAAVDSLNVSTSAAILLYEIIRQRSA
jgi:TrmH family RNA methyltransferase